MVQENKEESLEIKRSLGEVWMVLPDNPPYSKEVVNLSAITSFQRLPDGSVMIHLSSGRKIQSTTSFQEVLYQLGLVSQETFVGYG